jgi:hypothetical protein
MICDNRIRRWWSLWLLKTKCGRVMVTYRYVDLKEDEFYCWGCGNDIRKPFGPDHSFYKQ